MPDISALGWVALGIGALLGGFSKTAIGGVITIPIALFAAVLPARESTGTLLVLLLCGDLVGIWIYRRAVDWRLLVRLIPPVLVGILAGVWFLDHVGNTVMRRTIGAILIVLSLIQIGRMVAAWKLARASTASAQEPGQQAPERTGLQRLISLGYGLIAGFTTMVANAGGPVMSLYLLSRRFTMLHFLGTTAWFFFGVNLVKLPFSIGLGLISFSSLRIDVVLVPLVFVGCALGIWCIKRINQRTFEWLILGFTLVSSLYLLR